MTTERRLQTSIFYDNDKTSHKTSSSQSTLTFNLYKYLYLLEKILLIITIGHFILLKKLIDIKHLKRIVINQCLII